MSLDRRRTPRVPCDLPAVWRRGWRRDELRVRDLNADGMYLATDAKVALNYLMDLVIELPDGPLEVLVVARFQGRSRHGPGIGVAIHAIDPDDRKRWHAYHRRLLEQLVDRLPAGIGQHLRPPGSR